MKSKKKLIVQAFFFLALMGITFCVIFKNNDLSSVMSSIKSASGLSLYLSVFCALFFVAAEGFMIWYLLCCLGSFDHMDNPHKNCLPQCIGYSFVGFFFSGITPSATGGQPMQLYYMKKDGIALSEGTLVLMVVAVLYKFVLTLIGGLLLLFWHGGLKQYLGGYMVLFYLGMFLNLILVFLLLLVMSHGNWLLKILEKAEQLLIQLHILKKSEQRKESIHNLIAGYEDAFHFFLCHKTKIIFTGFCTLLQRCSLFILTYFIYAGLGLKGSNPLLIVSLQAAVFICVDMLPLPGSQGISELMYHTVFAGIISGSYLTASMCITRGIGFYLPLLLGVSVILIRTLLPKKIHQCSYQTRAE